MQMVMVGVHHLRDGMPAVGFGRDGPGRDIGFPVEHPPTAFTADQEVNESLEVTRVHSDFKIPGVCPEAAGDRHQELHLGTHVPLFQIAEPSRAWKGRSQDPADQILEGCRAASIPVGGIIAPGQGGKQLIDVPVGKPCGRIIIPQ